MIHSHPQVPLAAWYRTTVPIPLCRRALAARVLMLAMPGISAASAQDLVLNKAPTVRYTLANGLRVVLQFDDRQPRVAGVMAYDAGGRDDPPGYDGLAHLTEHMTFRGTRHLGDGEAYTTLEAVGARCNAATTPDHTLYYASSRKTAASSRCPTTTRRSVS